MIYEIHKYPTGEIMDYQKSLKYIRVNPFSGAYIEADESNYEGISVGNGIPCNILEHEGLKDVGTVFLSEADEGKLLKNLMQENEKLKSEMVTKEEVNRAYAEGVNEA